MVKVKQQRTADCVVGGYREGKNGVGSLLLGLYDRDGKLDYVGFTSSFSDDERAALKTKLAARPTAPRRSPATRPAGRAAGAAGAAAASGRRLKGDLVAEVIYDQVTGGRFRHGTTFLRWRPDKRPDQCTRDQLEHELSPAALAQVLEGA